VRKIIELEIRTDFAGIQFLYNLIISEHGTVRSTPYLVCDIYDVQGQRLGNDMFESMPEFKKLWPVIREACEGVIIDIDVVYELTESVAFHDWE